jgi:NADH-quinone oxidoreductase subunit J
MSIGSVFFALCSSVSLLGALATVMSKSPIRSAVGLLATIVGIAGLFLRLDAQFLAAIQLIVYAGAVVVLFVFVVMLLGSDAGHAQRAARAGLSRVLGGGLFALFSVGAGLLLGGASGQATRFQALPPGFGNVETVGALLFGGEYVPFELTTILLVVAAIGAIAVARSRHKPPAPERSSSPTRRLFHGPLHPRDAGRPLEREHAP